jgi:hypothetical protein
VEKFILMNKRIARLFFILFFIIIAGFFVSSYRHSLALTLDDSACEVSLAEECEDLLLTYKPGDTKFAQTRVAGTLLGLANFLQGASNTQPEPANLAFWWNDNVNRIPFAGRALAADINYSGPFLQIVLGVWKLARDVSYGVMAIVMLVVGFMIITRRKIGPQAAVTAQQALPRIVIALILITFSYPIGALGASAAYVMRGNAASVVNNISWESISPDDQVRRLACEPDKNLFEKIATFITDLNIRRTVLNFTSSLIFDGAPFLLYGKTSSEMASCGAYFLRNEALADPEHPETGATIGDSTSNGKLAAVMYAVLGGLLGNGPLALLVCIVILIASLIFGILVYIKFFMLYLRLLFSIIGAPLQFAFGAIPGNENVTSTWFKSFASIIISIPAMFFILDLAWVLSFKAILVALVESNAIGGGTLMLLIIPFVYIFGANFARQVPDKIDAMIMGDKKKGGKR